MSAASLLISATLLLSGSLLHAATPLPLWYGQPGTTRQGYTFGSGSQTPGANPLVNSYGTVSSQITLGSFSDGWQDPAEPVDLSGVDADGSWDLGLAGNFAVSAPYAPAAPAPGFYYRVDFQVYAVGYRGITALPNFSLTGATPSGLSMTQAFVANDPLFGGATWESRTWTGYFDTTTAPPVAFTISAPANNTSVIDTIEVFTRITLIPEPGSTALCLAAGLLLLRRRP